MCPAPSSSRTARNAVPSHVVIQGGTRSSTADDSRLVERRIRAIAQGTAAAHGARAEVEHTREFRPTVNHHDRVADMVAAATATVGADRVDDACPPVMASEDFSRLTEQVPGCFAFLGTGLTPSEGVRRCTVTTTTSSMSASGSTSPWCARTGVATLDGLTSGSPDVKGVGMVNPDALERQHTLVTAAARYDALRREEVLADADGSTLDRGSALEALALGEVLARKAAYGRQLTIRSARRAGASWAQIGDALGVAKQSAWEGHTRWIEEQAASHDRTDHEGMDVADVAEATALAGADSDH